MIVAVLLTAILLFLCGCCSCCLSIAGDLATVATCVFAGVGFVVACREYQKHKRHHKVEILSSLNERYASDENIKEVVIELLKSLKNDDRGDYFINKETWKSAKDEDIDKKVVYQREMFLRFFEELESYIEEDSLDTKVIKKTFAYYALQAASLQEDFVEDYNNGNWTFFKKFVEEMKKD